MEIASNAGKIALQRFCQFAFGKGRAVKVVRCAETREQDVDRVCIADV